MFRLNLKIALRNLWKNRGYTALNIFGLSVGLTGFIIILIYANHERSYDTWNPKSENVYRITIKGAPDEEEYSSSPAELAPALMEAVPEIENIGRFYTWDMKQRLVAKDNNEAYVDHIMGVDSTWFDLFPYKFIYGDSKKALLTKDQIVLSSKMSKQFFGNADPVGQTLLINTNQRYIVSGVYEKPNTPEHLDFDGFIKKSSTGDGWGNGNFYTYLLTKEGTDRYVLEDKINKAYKKLPILNKETWLKTAEIFVTPVTDIYLKSRVAQDPAKKGNPTIITILLLFSALLLVIACINFTNLSITQSIKRAKETGLRKVMGAKRSSLIAYFLIETTMQCFVALLFSFVLVEVSMPALNNLMDLNLSLLNFENPQLLLMQLFFVMVLVVILSGGYTAFFLSGYEPAKVLKGNLSKSIGSVWIRKSLILVQFSVATVFMVSLIIIKKQVNYIKNQDVGFNKDQVLVFKIRNGENRNNFHLIKQRLLKIEGVAAASRVNYYPGLKDMQVIGREYNGKSVQNLSVVTVDFDYFNVMGISAKTGRLFSSEFSTDSSAIVVNETAVRKYGLQKEIGNRWIEERSLIGVVKDHVQKGMENNADPTAYVIERRGTNAADNVIIKIKGNNIQQTLNEIKAVWETAEAFPFQYIWLDQSFGKLYLQYVRLDKLFNVFTYITLFIAVLGLFSLASFTVQERTKEIGVRKVLGAETLDILQMLNRSFVVLVIIANLIAIPLAYILANNWLSGFAYRTTITIWPFIFAVSISVLVTIITVSMQAYKSAQAKPVDALKYE